MRRLLAAVLGALIFTVAATVPAADALGQKKKLTIALIPGLTTDAFYARMRLPLGS